MKLPSGRTQTLLLGGLFVLLGSGCANVRTSEQKSNWKASIDLTERLAAIADPVMGSEGGAFHRGLPVTRKGIREIADVLVAPVSVEVPLEGVRGRAVLELRVAPVFNVGDGVGMQIMLVSGGVERELYSRLFDAARSNGDREWTSVSLPVDFGESEGAVLRIRASAGPHGDLVGDWLALVAPRLLVGEER